MPLACPLLTREGNRRDATSGSLATWLAGWMQGIGNGKYSTGMRSYDDELIRVMEIFNSRCAASYEDRRVA
jgi:hypothetical protein